VRRRPVVGIGASVFLIAVGAILAFGVNVSVGMRRDVYWGVRRHP
jgi:hypothetical protein